jgi:hypothetical protein
MQEKEYSFWCCTTQKMVILRGIIIGKRIVEVFKIHECEQLNCVKRQSGSCLIGKEIEGKIRDHFLEKENELIKKNLIIIKKNLNDTSKIKRKRLEFAIYRLYRYLNLSPKEISNITQIQETRVRAIIGKVFKYLCLTDTSCIFKPYFIGKSTDGNNFE